MILIAVFAAVVAGILLVEPRLITNHLAHLLLPEWMFEDED